ncbi:uncharacterized protein LOC144762681 [Lissotriton helveticus]
MRGGYTGFPLDEFNTVLALNPVPVPRDADAVPLASLVQVPPPADLSSLTASELTHIKVRGHARPANGSVFKMKVLSCLSLRKMPRMQTEVPGSSFRLRFQNESAELFISQEDAEDAD